MSNRFWLLVFGCLCHVQLVFAEQTEQEVKAAQGSKVLELSPLLEKRLQEIQEFRKRRHIWDRAVRGFRRDHHFALASGLDSGIWSGHVGSREQGFEFETTIPFVAFHYSFHIELWRDLGIGYFVGTRSRLFFLEKAEAENFERPRIYGLPGALGGLVWNVSPVLRFSLGIEGAPIRIDSFKVPGLEEESLISATAQVISYRFSSDLFLNLGSGLSLEYEFYRLTYDSPNQVRIRRRGENWALGLIWHLI